MGRKQTGRAKGASDGADAGRPLLPDSLLGLQYSYATLRPWPNLLFVLPMIAVFEWGIYRTQNGTPGAASQLVSAYLIERIVIWLGAGRFGYIFPALALVAILLASHLVARHPWRINPLVLVTMIGESLVCTIPLFAFNRVLHQALLAGAPQWHGGWGPQAIRSLGAGLYEELVFRLICITALDILLVNIIRAPRSASRLFAILLSAALFAGQHHPPLGADPFVLGDFLFRTVAGIYLAILFLYRGFGIAAGCHVFYNVIVVTVTSLRV
ncbi:MAG: CPBP family intramembrane metalloprotease [Phycisphaerae bacterium]|nr:CPBP family intramembrane metalloprotease [Phycisphaerae bacterium]